MPAEAGTRPSRDDWAAPPGIDSTMPEPAREPAEKTATSSRQACVAVLAQTTPTLVRARPGSVDDETSAPPPVASSPGPSSSDGWTAARLTPYRPADDSLYVSDQAVTAASERTL